MINLTDWLSVLAGGTVAGASTGLLGVYIVGMRIPFLAVCISHAALAGAVFASLVGVPTTALFWPALGGAVLTALVLGWLDSCGTRLDTNVLIGAIFAVSMGLVFLGLGMFSLLGRPEGDLRNLLWGSLPWCQWSDVARMSILLVFQVGFVAVCAKELRAILFSKSEAASMGIPVLGVWTFFLVLAAVVLVEHLKSVGGLMLYGLVINPAAAAVQLVRGHRQVVVLSTVLGATSGLSGFLLSAVTDLPTGALIVLVSAVVLFLAGIVARLKPSR